MVTVNETNREPDGTFETLEATRAIGNATYQSESDVPNDLTVGEQVWIESDNRTLVEDGT